MTSRSSVISLPKARTGISRQGQQRQSARGVEPTELGAEGFGVLGEIDGQATPKRKLGADREPYLILGACSPPLAHQALEREPDLGTLLPCNVVVYRHQGETHISAIDAERMLSIVDNTELAPAAAEVRRKLSAVVERAARS